ncbi:hypothetical protein B488_08970 [Liberibacter crescens BT-1]|uniref:HTH cro/C1-type domain-containing protein n=1 Tax=Liberibacter crescens (strain BT-1) TaxID=1215343 RepID=L0ETL9_LIBCB|nr:helix-turn-helix transcriptional regulator [Liberibacter crescens]AGA64889.1 hypothetical protein B488_08970 [Liberibacter crescens BT-1]
MDNIIKEKQPNRPHHIRDWAERNGYYSQADLANALNADKSVVSRWYKDSSPTIKWQKKLAEFFKCDKEALFRHPDDDWFSNFIEGRTKEEIERIKTMLQAAFPSSSDQIK